ncbi:MAG: nucleotidyl transferase AbiEii/AbiGii toxin family protein [Clostridiales Family XIII bacterium]|jgi:predicted nucleotidyltransferase component of viral defense system|nr:nucleotidyl transferase AbiEii/AbiGii toxin family protein [Clostridiales Family XIII bacterium]
MADRATSVLARLKNKAMETGRSNQLCLQLFCQEEFLRRLQRSRYANNMILKGGLFIYALTDFDSRVTVDVDFLLQSIPGTPEKLKPVLDEIISANTGNDFVTFEVTKVDSIAIAKKYAGIGATVIARIKNTRIPFGIDFGVGDVIVPKQEKRQIPTQLDDFESPLVSAYSVETTIAEKLDAIFILMEYSSRMKDYYDILYLSRKFDFDGATFKEAIAQTFVNRNREFGEEQFERFLALGDDAAMQKKWAAFLRKMDVSEYDFSEVMKALDAFLNDIVIAAVSGQKFTKSWKASDGRWLQTRKN